MRYPVLASQEDLYKHYRERNGLTTHQKGEAKAYEVARSGISVEVTVPDEVLEWYVSVKQGGEERTSDWCDYAGYDDTPIVELARSMVDDISRFLELLLSSKIRIDSTGKRPTLDGFVNGEWIRIVPFTGES